MHRRGVLECLGAAVLFGASTPLAAHLVGELDALVLAGLLYLGAGIALAPTALRRPPSRAALRRAGPMLATAVVVGGAIAPALFVSGLARTSAATASLMLNLEVVATAVLAALLFREHLGRRLVLAVTLVAVAGALLVWEPGVGVDAGAVLVALACLGWGLDNNVTARIDQLAPQHITVAKGLVAGTVNLLLGLVLLHAGAPPLRAVLAALAVGAAGYGLSITLWVRGARELGAARGQVLFATAPFIGAALAWLAFGADVTGTQLLAALVAAIGVAISLRSEHEHTHTHERVEHEHEHSHDDLHHTHEHTEVVQGRHTHRHVHEPVTHRHPHVPDLHHRHEH